MKEYKEIKDFFGSIEEAVYLLNDINLTGSYDACINFNGHMLYSDTVTMDRAYKEVLGCTKEEFDKGQKEMRQRIIQAEEEHKKQIPRLTEEWIAKGHNILDEKYWPLWDKCVPIRLDDIYHGMELGACLDIVKELNNDCTLKEAEDIIDSQDHSGMSRALVAGMVNSFCDRGKDFCLFLKGY